MINVNGSVRVTNLKKISEKLTVGDVYTSRKNKDEEWETTFVKAKFVGKSLKQMKKMKIGNKGLFKIENGILENDVNGNYSNLTITIFEVSEVIQDDIKPINDGDQPF